MAKTEKGHGNGIKDNINTANARENKPAFPNSQTSSSHFHLTLSESMI